MFGIPMEAIVGISTGILGYLGKRSAQKHADFMALAKNNRENVAQINDTQDSASKRGSSFLRKTIAIIIVGGFTMALIAVAWFPEVVVTVIEQVPQKSFLGFKWGDTYEVIQMNGLVIPTWVRFSVVSIIGYLFGAGGGSTTSK